MRKSHLVILPGARSLTQMGALLLFLACPNIAFVGRDRQDIQPSCSFSTMNLKWLQKKPESEFLNHQDNGPLIPGTDHGKEKDFKWIINGDSYSMTLSGGNESISNHYEDTASCANILLQSNMKNKVTSSDDAEINSLPKETNDQEMTVFSSAEHQNRRENVNRNSFKRMTRGVYEERLALYRQTSRKLPIRSQLLTSRSQLYDLPSNSRVFLRRDNFRVGHENNGEEFLQNKSQKDTRKRQSELSRRVRNPANRIYESRILSRNSDYDLRIYPIRLMESYRIDSKNYNSNRQTKEHPLSNRQYARQIRSEKRMISALGDDSILLSNSRQSPRQTPAQREDLTHLDTRRSFSFVTSVRRIHVAKRNVRNNNGMETINRNSQVDDGWVGEARNSDMSGRFESRIPSLERSNERRRIEIRAVARRLETRMTTQLNTNARQKMSNSNEAFDNNRKTETFRDNYGNPHKLESMPRESEQARLSFRHNSPIRSNARLNLRRMSNERRTLENQVETRRDSRRDSTLNMPDRQIRDTRTEMADQSNPSNSRMQSRRLSSERRQDEARIDIRRDSRLAPSYGQIRNARSEVAETYRKVQMFTRIDDRLIDSRMTRSNIRDDYKTRSESRVSSQSRSNNRHKFDLTIINRMATRMDARRSSVIRQKRSIQTDVLDNSRHVEMFRDDSRLANPESTLSRESQLVRQTFSDDSSIRSNFRIQSRQLSSERRILERQDEARIDIRRDSRLAPSDGQIRNARSEVADTFKKVQMFIRMGAPQMESRTARSNIRDDHLTRSESRVFSQSRSNKRRGFDVTTTNRRDTRMYARRSISSDALDSNRRVETFRDDSRLTSNREQMLPRESRLALLTFRDDLAVRSSSRAQTQRLTNEPRVVESLKNTRFDNRHAPRLLIRTIRYVRNGIVDKNRIMTSLPNRQERSVQTNVLDNSRKVEKFRDVSRLSNQESILSKESRLARQTFRVDSRLSNQESRLSSESNHARQTFRDDYRLSNQESRLSRESNLARQTFRDDSVMQSSSRIQSRRFSNERRVHVEENEVRVVGRRDSIQTAYNGKFYNPGSERSDQDQRTRLFTRAVDRQINIMARSIPRADLVTRSESRIFLQRVSNERTESDIASINRMDTRMAARRSVIRQKRSIPTDALDNNRRVETFRDDSRLTSYRENMVRRESRLALLTFRDDLAIRSSSRTQTQRLYNEPRAVESHKNTRFDNRHAPRLLIRTIRYVRNGIVDKNRIMTSLPIQTEAVSFGEARERSDFRMDRNMRHDDLLIRSESRISNIARELGARTRRNSIIRQKQINPIPFDNNRRLDTTRDDPILALNRELLLSRESKLARLSFRDETAVRSSSRMQLRRLSNEGSNTDRQDRVRLDSRRDSRIPVIQSVRREIRNTRNHLTNNKDSKMLSLINELKAVGEGGEIERRTSKKERSLLNNDPITRSEPRILSHIRSNERRGFDISNMSRRMGVQMTDRRDTIIRQKRNNQIDKLETNRRFTTNRDDTRLTLNRDDTRLTLNRDDTRLTLNRESKQRVHLSFRDDFAIRSSSRIQSRRLSNDRVQEESHLNSRRNSRLAVSLPQRIRSLSGVTDQNRKNQIFRMEETHLATRISRSIPRDSSPTRFEPRISSRSSSYERREFDDTSMTSRMDTRRGAAIHLKRSVQTGVLDTNRRVETYRDDSRLTRSRESIQAREYKLTRLLFRDDSVIRSNSKMQARRLASERRILEKHDATLGNSDKRAETFRDDSRIALTRESLLSRANKLARLSFRDDSTIRSNSRIQSRRFSYDRIVHNRQDETLENGKWDSRTSASPSQILNARNQLGSQNRKTQTYSRTKRNEFVVYSMVSRMSTRMTSRLGKRILEERVSISEPSNNNRRLQEIRDDSRLVFKRESALSRESKLARSSFRNDFGVGPISIMQARRLSNERRTLEGQNVVRIDSRRDSITQSNSRLLSREIANVRREYALLSKSRSGSQSRSGVLENSLRNSLITSRSITNTRKAQSFTHDLMLGDIRESRSSRHSGKSLTREDINIPLGEFQSKLLDYYRESEKQEIVRRIASRKDSWLPSANHQNHETDSLPLFSENASIHAKFGKVLDLPLIVQVLGTLLLAFLLSTQNSKEARSLRTAELFFTEVRVEMLNI